MASNIVLSTILFSLAAMTIAQENTQTNVAPSLMECYNTTELREKNYKLPATINVLLDLLRKIENGPAPMDLRMLTTNVLHRFRQDGIQKAANVVNPNVLPYSPSGDENHKFKIIMKKLISGNAVLFPNNTLTPVERCSLHSMLSESIEFQERGDENQVCNKLARFTVRRIRRDTGLPADVEIMDHELLKKIKSGKGNLREPANPNSQVDQVPGTRSVVRSILTENLSACPVENGVIYTKWGAVSAGNLLAGIASGTERVNIDVRNIIDSGQQYLIDNAWGSTLAGDLAEVAYLSTGLAIDIAVGADGGWTSTQVPRQYYLNRNQRLYMTDPEIRGDLDGLILGTKMKEYMSTASSMKLSQLLDMYYSQRGVLGDDIRACKRRELFKEYAPTEIMEQQALSFAVVLNKKVTVPVTMDLITLEDIVRTTVERLNTYVPTMNDLNCVASEDVQIVATDVIIFLDTEWQFEVIYPALSNFLDNIDINPYNSNYTLINANDGSVIVNGSSSIVEFHSKLNETTYGQLARGFDLKLVVNQMENIAKNKMEQERRNGGGGRSLIAVLLAHSLNIDDKDKDYIIDRINNVIRIEIPDLKLFALTSVAKESFGGIVKDSSRDVFELTESTDGTSISSSISPFLKRIREIPRRIVNSKCGSDWEENGPDKQLNQYVEPKGINFYRVHANYFFGDEDRGIKIRGYGTGVLNICHSRTNELPRSNSAQNTTTGGENEITCKRITSDEYTIELNDACSGKSVISDCPSLYFSVEAPDSSKKSGRYNACIEPGCRYPDNVKYTITLDNLGCYSSASYIYSNIFIVISMLVFMYT